MSASSPPPKAPTSPSLADHPSDSNNQPSLVDPSKTKSGVDTEHSDTGSAGTSPGDTAANVLEEPDEDAAARSNKRARTDLPDEEDSLPSPKRVSKRSTPDLDYAGMTAPADADDGPETATNDSEDNASVVAKPKKQPQKSRKAPTKKTTAKAGRSRACATCKRRKVSECVSNHKILNSLPVRSNVHTTPPTKTPLSKKAEYRSLQPQPQPNPPQRTTQPLTTCPRKTNLPRRPTQGRGPPQRHPPRPQRASASVAADLLRNPKTPNQPHPQSAPARAPADPLYNPPPPQPRNPPAESSTPPT